MKILQVILALSILIILHECGHFFFAKMFHIRVDKFFIFFDFGGFKLFSTKGKFFTKIFPRAKDWETEYGIGWMPLGGYCKINGMIDESMDTETIKNEPQPWEFRSKPAWKRLLVLLGGVLNNFIFAILVFIAILAIWGSSYISNDGNAIYTDENGVEMGFQNGDRILKIDEYVPEDFSMLQAEIARREANVVTVLRGSDTVKVYIDKSSINVLLNDPNIFDLAIPFVIDSVASGSANASAGLVKGDRIIAMDSVSTPYVQDSRIYMATVKGQEVTASVLRGADTLKVPLQVDTSGRVGVYMQIPGLSYKTYSVAEAIPAGCKLTFDTIWGYIRDLKLVATPSTGAYKSVGSFIAIGQVFPSTWDWYRFMYILAILSIMLAVMNLIPIPGLDGGHALFTLYEMVTGHKPSDQFLIVAQIIGMALLLLLMALAFGNDIARLLR